MDRAIASRELLAQHTTPVPSLSLADTVAALTVAGQVDARTVATNAKLQDTVLAMLAYRFTPIALAAIDALDEAEESRAMAVSLAVLPHLDDTHRQRLLDEILFNFAHPAAYQAIWSALIELFPAADMEAALLARARSDNELHAHNALHLPYYIYGRAPTFPLSDAGRVELENMIADLDARNDLNPLVREALAAVRLPANL